MNMIITAACATIGAFIPNNRHQKALTTTTKMRENKQKKTPSSYNFTMPLHYPRYSKADYEAMPEWKLDLLLAEYGLPIIGDVDDKRKFAVGAFLWPSQRDDH